MSAQVAGCLIMFALGFCFCMGGIGLAGMLWVSSMWGGFWRIWQSIVFIVLALLAGAIGITLILWAYSMWPYVWVLK